MQSYDFEILMKQGIPIILSKNSARIHDYLIDIQNILKKHHYKGKCIFDLLLSNGIDKNNRFFEAHFNGRYFDLTSFKNIKEINTYVEKTSNSFYANNFDLIDNSILTKPQKFLLKKRLSLTTNVSISN